MPSRRQHHQQSTSTTRKRSNMFDEPRAHKNNSIELKGADDAYDNTRSDDSVSSSAQFLSSSNGAHSKRQSTHQSIANDAKKRYLMTGTGIAVVLGLSVIVIAIVVFFAVALATDSNAAAPELFDPQVFNMTKNSAIDRLRWHTRQILSFGPRVPGFNDAARDQVRDYIRSELMKNGWTVSLDSFSQDLRSLLGKTVTFHNVIAQPLVQAEKASASQNRTRLVVAAHYDSKLFEEFSFLGATDSAVSCAMMLHFAELFNSTWFQARNERLQFDLQFVFFDGEEAYRQWSDTDSTYGSRHLAALWQQQNTLQNVEVLILLDLIGAKSPLASFYDYSVPHYRNARGKNYFLRMIGVERMLKQLNRIHYKSHQYFNGLVQSQIEDDHVPFMNLGVRVAHLIPSPFPYVWHTSRDDESAVDYYSTYDVHYIVVQSLYETLLGTSKTSV